MSEVWIWIEHPDLEDSAHTVTLSSFLNLHEKKGWEAIETPSNLPETPGETFNRVFGNIGKEEAPVKGPKKSKSAAKKAESPDD